MIDITKVTHTRAGYPVYNVREYRGNDNWVILADVLYEGEVSAEAYTINGYYHNNAYESTYDLVENQEYNHARAYKEDNRREIDVIEELLSSLVASLSVGIRELEEIKRKKNKE